MIINGNLEFHTLGSGELKNAIMERFTTTTRDALTSGDLVAGRIIYNTTTNEYNFYNGTTWEVFGDNAAITALQTEVDNIETSMGANLIETDGTFDSTNMNLLSNVSGATNLYDVLSDLNDAIDTAVGIDTLAELTDVTITSSAANELLFTTGANTWVNYTLTEAGIQAQDDVLDDISALAVIADDQIMIGTGAGTLGYLTMDPYMQGLMSNASEAALHSAINLVIGTDVQAYDAGLASIAGLTTAADTMIYTTALDTYATTALTPFARSILDDVDETTFKATVSLTIGTDVQAYSAGLDDLAALATVADDQIIIGTGAGTFGYLSVTPYMQGLLDDTDEATLHASINLEIGTNVQAYDAFITSVADLGTAADKMIYTTGVDTAAEADITATGRAAIAAADANALRTVLELNAGENGDIWVEKAGDTMSGILAMGSNRITGLADGIASTDAATKGQVDAAQAGILVKEHVRVATTAALPAVTAAGSGVGKTLTADAVGVVTIDGEDITAANSWATGDRILVKDQVAAADNGIYTVTTLSAAGTALVLTRATDYDGSPTAEVSHGTFTFVSEGAVNDFTGWTLSETGLTGSGTPIEAVVDTDPLTFYQFQGLPQFSASEGIDLTSNVFTLDFDAGLSAATIVGADTLAFHDATDSTHKKTTVTNFITDLGLTSNVLSNGDIFVGSAGGVATGVTMSGDATIINDGTLTIANSAVTLAKMANLADAAFIVGPSGGGTPAAVTMSGDATMTFSGAVTVADNAITLAKMAGLASANFILGNGSGDPAAVTMSGDVTMDNAGATTIAAGAVDLAMMASIGDGNIIVGAATSGNPTAVAMSGDVTISNTGVTTIGAGAVDNSMLANSDVTMAGDTGSDPVALGETFTITGGTLTTTTVAANAVTIDVAADIGDLGDSAALNNVAGEVMVDAGSAAGLAPQMIQFIYGSDGVAATTHTVTHNLGQQFVNVTVLDDTTNDVIIPESISMDTANQLVVTFNTAIHCKVIVMGIPGVTETAVTLS